MGRADPRFRSRHPPGCPDPSGRAGRMECSENVLSGPSPDAAMRLRDHQKRVHLKNEESYGILLEPLVAEAKWSFALCSGACNGSPYASSPLPLARRRVALLRLCLCLEKCSCIILMTYSRWVMPASNAATLMRRSRSRGTRLIYIEFASSGFIESHCFSAVASLIADALGNVAAIPMIVAGRR